MSSWVLIKRYEYELEMLEESYKENDGKLSRLDTMIYSASLQQKLKLEEDHVQRIANDPYYEYAAIELNSLVTVEEPGLSFFLMRLTSATNLNTSRKR